MRTNSVKVFSAFADVIETFGENNVIEITELLSTAKTESAYIKHLIIILVAKHFKISVQDIIESRKRNTRSDARAVCCYLLRKRLNYSNRQIIDIIGRKSRSTVSFFVKFIDTLDPAISLHRGIIKMLNDIQMDIDIQINNYKNNNNGCKD